MYTPSIRFLNPILPVELKSYGLSFFRNIYQCVHGVAILEFTYYANRLYGLINYNYKSNWD